MNVRAQSSSVDMAARSNRRAQWMRQIKQWHWISGAISLLGMLLFAITGITLNHSASIEAKPAVSAKEVVLSHKLLATLKDDTATKKGRLPQAIATWLVKEVAVDVGDREGEWSDGEIYVSLPRPGGDAWLSIDRSTGDVRYELTRRGWIAYLNDLHKGRNTGSAWSLFIDLFAVACIVFCVTGLLLLQLYAKGRALTWPLVGFGLALPLLIAVFLIH